MEALAARATLPVDVSGLPPERLSEPIEAAAFYVVSESLTNVAKYASASRAQVDLVRDDGLLVVEVSDDGVGGADADKGSGLRGPSDRVEALGGRLGVASQAGRGTTVPARSRCLAMRAAREGAPVVRPLAGEHRLAVDPLEDVFLAEDRGLVAVGSSRTASASATAVAKGVSSMPSPSVSTSSSRPMPPLAWLSQATSSWRSSCAGVPVAAGRITSTASARAWAVGC